MQMDGLIIWYSKISQRIHLASPAVKNASVNCVMRKEQEKMWATIASAVERTLASALKGVVQTALKAM
jgi:hypothetical protein